ncbi:MAG: trigger factor [Flavobacteriaceae bacterium]|nr:trigger factor [Flavobacteriaceae bacterium]
MNVTRTNHDDVSALLTITLNKADYKEKVDSALNSYAKRATIPGFRKGKAPMSLIRKQYEEAVTLEEVNKQVSETLNKYVADNNLRLLGQPIPQETQTLDFNAEEVSVNFEIGFEPEFDIDLSKYSAEYYKVEAGDKEVQKSIGNMQKRFAEKVTKNKATKKSHINFTVSEIVEEGATPIHRPKRLSAVEENKAAFSFLKELKAGESKEVSIEELTANENELAKEFGFHDVEITHFKNEKFEVKIDEIFELKDAELNQDLFDKIYGKDEIKSEEELKARVKSELDDFFQQNSEAVFVNQILEQIYKEDFLIIPDTFLTKWVMYSNPDIKDEEQAKQIIENERAFLKTQMVENKLRTAHNIQYDFEEVLSHAKLSFRNQLMSHGVHHIGDEELHRYVLEMLRDREQMRRYSSEVLLVKIRSVVLEKASKKEKELSYDEFMKKIQTKEEK